MADSGDSVERLLRATPEENLRANLRLLREGRCDVQRQAGWDLCMEHEVDKLREALRGVSSAYSPCVPGGTAMSGYTVETRENGRRIGLLPIDDPFIHTTVRPTWRAALAVLLGRYEVAVLVSADRELIERVLALSPEPPYPFCDVCGGRLPPGGSQESCFNIANDGTHSIDGDGWPE